MATHKAAVLLQHGTSPVFETQTLPRPSPGPNEVLIKLSLTSVCGSDYGLATGHLGPTRSILGHEGVGRVFELGANVASIDPSVEVGQRVGVAWIRDACGTCKFCQCPDGEVRCEGFNHSGRKFDGTFAEYTLVPLRYLTRIPPELDSVPDEEVAPILCGGVTAYKAIKSCQVVPGQWIAISGAGGGVGALGIMYAKAMGYRVIAVDASATKGEYCLSIGAEHYVDVTVEKDAGAAVKNLTGGKGANAVIITAGVGAAYQAAFDMLAPFGTYMCVGIPPPDQKVTFHPLQPLDGGFRIMGSVVGTRMDIIEALEFVKRRMVLPKIEFANLDDMNMVIKAVAEGKINGKYIIKFDHQ